MQTAFARFASGPIRCLSLDNEVKVLPSCAKCRLDSASRAPSGLCERHQSGGFEKGGGCSRDSWPTVLDQLGLVTATNNSRIFQYKCRFQFFWAVIFHLSRVEIFPLHCFLRERRCKNTSRYSNEMVSRRSGERVLLLLLSISIKAAVGVSARSSPLCSGFLAAVDTNAGGID
ncbi:hypothetical protein CEXT_116401 [Caerostris extrusa]|uniref:Uncharacterized protein n=1 Tax=Caerostris extrusa TaxID=172846 RepID=A0AAV4VD61_CAEEX|nr:hypothetical protein CEXT_116401 [Caerostris extrusa]